MDSLGQGLGTNTKPSTSRTDLKPENFLLKTRDGPIDKDNLRAVDFGLSTFFQDGQVAKEVVGYYPIPCLHHYSNLIDSAGLPINSSN